MDAEMLANPYLLFERDEAAADRTAFGTIDRGVFPADADCAKPPLAPGTEMSDGIDRRRVRGLVTELLERAVQLEGHTVLPQNWIVPRALVSPPPPQNRAARSTRTFSTWRRPILRGLWRRPRPRGASPALKLKRYDSARTAITNAVRKRVSGRRTDGVDDISTRQYARPVGDWVESIGLGRSAFGTHSLRRTKVALIYKRRAIWPPDGAEPPLIRRSGRLLPGLAGQSS